MTANWTLRLTSLTQLSAMGIMFAFEAVRMKDMGIGETAIGVILSASNALVIVTSIFWARLADRKHWHRAIAIAGSIAASALLMYFSFCRTPAHFAIYAVFKGITIPMITGMMAALAVQTFGRQNPGKKIGTYRAFGSMGFILGTMLLPLIFNDLGVVARVASSFILVSAFLLRNLEEPAGEREQGAPLGFRGMRPAIRLFLASYFFVALAEPAVHGFFSAYARHLGGSTRLLGMLSGTMGFVALVSLPLMGRWFDRSSPTFILSVAFAAQPVRVFLTSTIGQPEMLWIPLLLHGICWGGTEVASIVYLTSLARENQRATVLSFYFAMRMLGMLIGSAMSGYLAENLGYIPMFQTMSAIAMIGACTYVVGVYFFRIGSRSHAEIAG